MISKQRTAVLIGLLGVATDMYPIYLRMQKSKIIAFLWAKSSSGTRDITENRRQEVKTEEKLKIRTTPGRKNCRISVGDISLESESDSDPGNAKLFTLRR